MESFLFGTGRLAESLMERTQAMRLNDRVHWMGYRAGLGDEFAGLDLLLSLSTYEGLPINLLESGWAGTPIFSTPLGGVLDLVRPGLDGFLLPSDAKSDIAADQLMAALGNKNKLSAAGESLQMRSRLIFQRILGWLALN